MVSCHDWTGHCPETGSRVFISNTIIVMSNCFKKYSQRISSYSRFVMLFYSHSDSLFDVSFSCSLRCVFIFHYSPMCLFLSLFGVSFSSLFGVSFSSSHRRVIFFLSSVCLFLSLFGVSFSFSLRCVFKFSFSLVCLQVFFLFGVSFSSLFGVSFSSTILIN